MRTLFPVSSMKKFLAGVSAAAVLHSTVAAPLAEANFWADRQSKAKAVGRNGSSPQMARASGSLQGIMQSVPLVTQSLSALQDLPSAVSRKIPQSRLPEWMKSLPLAYGDVQDVVLASGSDKWVVLVSDVHAHEEAQRNISRILEHLAAGAKPDLFVGVEGASGAFDFQPYRRLASPENVQKTADHLVRLGYAGGAQHFGLTARVPASLFGVEAPADYLGNVEAFFRSRPLLPSMENHLNTWRAELSELKKSGFSPELLDLDGRRESFQAGRLPLKDYLKTLRAVLPPSARYASLAKFMEALRLEESMDFQAVERERALLLEELAGSLEKNEMDALVALSLAYRAGQVAYGTYYHRFKDLCDAHRVSLARYPAFDGYVKYLMLADAVDRRAVFDELTAWEEEAAGRLISTDVQRTVWTLSKDAGLADKLVRQSLTTREWSLYESRRSEIKDIPARLSKLTGRPAEVPPLDAFESFYDFAARRDRSMVGNFLARAGGRGLSVLVAGGFHSAGMAGALRKGGLNVLTLSPKLTQTGNAHYMAAFTREHTPLDKVLLGEKLFLTTPLLVGAGATPISLENLPDQKKQELYAAALLSAQETAGAAGLNPGDAAALAQKAGVLVAENFPAFSTIAFACERAAGPGDWKVSVLIDGKERFHFLLNQDGRTPADVSVPKTGRVVDEGPWGKTVVTEPGLAAALAGRADSLARATAKAAETEAPLLRAAFIGLPFFSRDWIKKNPKKFVFVAAVVGPFLETLLAHLLDFDSTRISVGLLVLAGLIFAAIHPDVWLERPDEWGRRFRRAANKERLTKKQFFALILLRFLAGMAFVALLHVSGSVTLPAFDLSIPSTVTLPWMESEFSLLSFLAHALPLNLPIAIWMIRRIRRGQPVGVVRPFLMAPGASDGDEGPAYGYYDAANREFVITDPETPTKWVNYIGTLEFGGYVDQTGGMNISKGDPALNRITYYDTNLDPKQPRGNTLYLRIKNADGSYTIFSPFVTPGMDVYDKYECRVGLGYNKYTTEMNGIRTEVTIFVPKGASQVVQDIRVTNISGEPLEVDVAPVAQYSYPDALEQEKSADFVPRTMVFDADKSDDGKVVLRQFPHMRKGKKENFITSNRPASFTTDRKRFLGRHGYGSNASPEALAAEQLDGHLANGFETNGDVYGVLLHPLGVLPPDGTSQVITQLGQAALGEAKSVEEALPSIADYRDPQKVTQALQDLKDDWDAYLKTLTDVNTPDEQLNHIMNVLGPRQNFYTFYFSRYLSPSQLGMGKDRGIGVRDTNQDLMGVIARMPDKAREMIEKLLSVQKHDGSSFHQFNPLTMVATNGEAVDPERDFYSDDHLWNILAVVKYVKETGDRAFLDKVIPYCEEDGHVSEEKSGTVLEHLHRAMAFTRGNTGQHGLPLSGWADWNDGMNLPAGSESVFTACLYGKALLEMEELMRVLGDEESVGGYAEDHDEMNRIVNKHAWDGEWYISYIDAKGNPVGSKKNEEGQIYLYTQAWAAMSGFATPERAAQALDSVERLLNTENGIKVTTPPYKRPVQGVGATFYPGGRKENAGVFVHPNPWAAIAETMRRRGKRVWEILNQINPLKKKQSRFQESPYVFSQNLTADPHPEPGVARNPWLSGTVSWVNQASTENMLGILPGYDGLRIDPVLPEDWPGYTAKRVFQGVTYDIEVQRGEEEAGSMTVDGETVAGGKLIPHALVADKKGGTVKVVVTMGKKAVPLIEELDRQNAARREAIAASPDTGPLRTEELQTMSGAAILSIFLHHRMRVHAQGLSATLEFPAGMAAGAPGLSFRVDPFGMITTLQNAGRMIRFKPRLRRASVPTVHVGGKSHMLTMLKPDQTETVGEWDQEYPDTVPEDKVEATFAAPQMNMRFNLGDVVVERTTISPLESDNLDDVATPAMVDVYELNNLTDQEQTVTLVLNQANLANLTETKFRAEQDYVFEGQGATLTQVHEEFESDTAKGVVMGHKKSKEKMVIAVPKMEGVAVDVQPSFRLPAHKYDLLVKPTGEFAQKHEPDPVYECGAAISVTVKVPAGKSVKIPFTTVLDFPDQKYLKDGKSVPRAYLGRFRNRRSRATDMAEWALADHQNWLDRADAIQSGVFEIVRSDPSYREDRKGALRLTKLILNEIPYLLSNVSVWARKGVARFLECFDYPFNNSADVDWYTALLLMIFPSVEKKICQKFIDSIDEEDLTEVWYHWHAAKSDLQEEFLEWRSLKETGASNLSGDDTQRLFDLGKTLKPYRAEKTEWRALKKKAAKGLTADETERLSALNEKFEGKSGADLGPDAAEWEALNKKQSRGMAETQAERLLELNEIYEGESTTHIRAARKIKGSVKHDIGSMNNGHPLRGDSDYNWYNTNYWVDFFSKLASRVLRDAKYTNDPKFVYKNFEKLERGYDYWMSLDHDGDGIPEGNDGEVKNTFDNITLFGYDSYSANLALTGHKSMIRMAEMMLNRAKKARRLDDVTLYEAKIAKFQENFRKASEAFEKLWVTTPEGDGYYATCYDPKTGEYSKDVWTNQLDGLWSWIAQGENPDDLVSPDRVRQALKTIYKNNRVTNGWATQRTQDGKEVESDQGKDVWIASNYVLAQLLYYYDMDEESKEVYKVMEKVLLERDNLGVTPESIRPDDNKFIVKGYPRPGAVWTQLLFIYLKSQKPRIQAGETISHRELKAFMKSIFKPQRGGPARIAAEAGKGPGKWRRSGGRIPFGLLRQEGAASGRNAPTKSGGMPINASNIAQTEKTLNAWLNGWTGRLWRALGLPSTPAGEATFTALREGGRHFGFVLLGAAMSTILAAVLMVQIASGAWVLGPIALAWLPILAALPGLIGAFAAIPSGRLFGAAHGTRAREPGVLRMANLLTGLYGAAALAAALGAEVGIGKDSPLFIALGGLAALILIAAGLASHAANDVRPIAQKTGRVDPSLSEAKAREARRLMFQLNHPRSKFPPFAVGAWTRLAELFNPIAGRYDVEAVQHNGKPAYRLSDLASKSFFIIAPSVQNDLHLVSLNGMTTFESVQTMWPYIDRVKDGVITVDGEEIALKDLPTDGPGKVTSKYDGDETVCHANVGPWEVEGVFFGPEGVGLRTSFDTRDNAALFDKFKEGRIALTVSVKDGKLKKKFDVRNSTVFSTGSHMFVKNNKGVDEWFGLVPAQEKLVNEGPIPTGKRIRFDETPGSEYDLRRFTPIDRVLHGTWGDLIAGEDGYVTSYLYNRTTGQLIITKQKNLPFVTLWAYPDNRYGDQFAFPEPVSGAPDSLNDNDGSRRLGRRTEKSYEAEVIYESRLMVGPGSNPLPIDELEKALGLTGLSGSKMAQKASEPPSEGAATDLADIRRTLRTLRGSARVSIGLPTVAEEVERVHAEFKPAVIDIVSGSASEELLDAASDAALNIDAYELGRAAAARALENPQAPRSTPELMLSILEAALPVLTAAARSQGVATDLAWAQTAAAKVVQGAGQEIQNHMADAVYADDLGEDELGQTVAHQAAAALEGDRRVIFFSRGAASADSIEQSLRKANPRAADLLARRLRNGTALIVDELAQDDLLDVGAARAAAESEWKIGPVLLGTVYAANWAGLTGLGMAARLYRILAGRPPEKALLDDVLSATVTEFHA